MLRVGYFERLRIARPLHPTNHARYAGQPTALDPTLSMLVGFPSAPSTGSIHDATTGRDGSLPNADRWKEHPERPRTSGQFQELVRRHRFERLRESGRAAEAGLASKRLAWNRPR